MYVSKLILILIFVLSCSKDEGLQFQERWSTFSSVEHDFGDKLDLSNPIKIAKDKWTNILKINLLSFSGNTYSECVLRLNNLLKVVQLDPSKKCIDMVSQQSIFEIDDVYNMSFKIDQMKLTLYLDEKTYIITSMNSESVTATSYEGNSVVSTLDKAYLEGKECIDYDSDCNVISNKCHLCPQGWNYSIKNSCGNSLMKICTSRRCGSKNSLACRRGNLNLNLRDRCFENSPLGFCNRKLRPICYGKNLICE